MMAMAAQIRAQLFYPEGDLGLRENGRRSFFWKNNNDSSHLVALVL